MLKTIELLRTKKSIENQYCMTKKISADCQETFVKSAQITTLNFLIPALEIPLVPGLTSLVTPKDSNVTGQNHDLSSIKA